MKKWEKYYGKTVSEKPSKILIKFFEMGLDKNLNNKNAIDLGCGSGNDTIYLLKKGYNVTCIDKEEQVIDIIKNRIQNTSKLEFVIDEFEKVKLKKTSLIIANLSIFFCNPKYFNEFCNQITDNISQGGYFVGNFLGKEDDWSNDNNKTFVDAKKIYEIFKDFEIVFLKELKFNKNTVKGNMKFWHIYQVIARKI